MNNLSVWKRVFKKKKGLYGETDFQHKTITVNKERHKSKGTHGNGIKKNKNGSASIIDTIVHEEMHSKHPKMHEKTVRRLTPRKLKVMSNKNKKRLYSKYK